MVFEWTEAYFDFGRSFLTQFKEQEAPITSYLIGLTALVFSIQTVLYLIAVDNLSTGVLTILLDRNVFLGLNAYYFLNNTWVAWPLSEFIHRGIGHFISNIAILALFGKILEPKFRTRHYITWFVSVAIITTSIHAYIELANSLKPTWRSMVSHSPSASSWHCTLFSLKTGMNWSIPVLWSAH